MTLVVRRKDQSRVIRSYSQGLRGDVLSKQSAILNGLDKLDGVWICGSAIG